MVFCKKISDFLPKQAVYIFCFKKQGFTGSIDRRTRLCPALPVADKAGHKRVQRSARDKGIRAEDIRRAPQTDWARKITTLRSCVLTAAARR